jgi:hypothetical protein
MISINSVLFPAEDAVEPILKEPVVIVYGDHTRDLIFLVNLLGKPKKPLRMSFSLLVTALDNGELQVAALEAPDYFTLPDTILPEKTILKRDVIWEAIQPLVENLDEFFFPTYGRKLVERAANKAGKTRYQIYKWLYICLRYGQTKSAVTPNYTNTGSGKRKPASSKIGAPRQNSTGDIGKNIDSHDKNNITKILRQHYWKENGMSLTQCLTELDRSFYVAGKTIDHNGHVKVQLKSENERVSINELRYWEKKIAEKLSLNSVRLRTGATKYDKDNKGRTGDKVVAQGPGHIYEIDSTPIDFESVSQFSVDRTLNVGRATVYWVRDQFSSAFTGLHITLEPASFHTARLALYNAFRDKESYCREYGIAIDSEDWPQQGVATKVVADNAELRSNLAGSVTVDSGVTIMFTKEYRGDGKGLIEVSFALQHAFLKDRVDGYIPKTAGERGTPEPKLKANLTVNELAQILIQYAVHFNKTHEVDPNLLDKAVVAAGIPLTPNEIWKWGIKYRPFNRKAKSEKDLYINLLEMGTATATRVGLKFEGLIYNSRELHSLGLLDRKLKAHTSKKVEIRFMRHNMNHIWILQPNGDICASLSVYSRRFVDCSLNEVDQQLAREADEAKSRKQTQDESAASLSENIHVITTKAKSEQATLTSKSLRNQSVADNRQLVIDNENQKEAHRYEVFSSSRSETSLEQNTDHPESQDLSLTKKEDKSLNRYQSSMDELLKKEIK